MEYFDTAAYDYTAKRVNNLRTAFLLDGGNVVAEVQNNTVTNNYLRGVNLIRRDSTNETEYYLFNAHGDVVTTTNLNGTINQSYDYDAFGNEKTPDILDSNPFRYCGEYLDFETGDYYLRARYYDPTIGRFTQQDTHWNTANMIYGDTPQKINEREDKLGLKTCSYAPQITAILQSGNLYVYCVNTPILYKDYSGNELTLVLAGGGIIEAGAAVGAANSWNPAGWALLGIVGLVVIGLIIYNSKDAKRDSATEKAIDALNNASSAATPPPPNDPKGKGTRTTSTTLYDKNGIRIDVENPGNRLGQIHVQTGGSKYIYDVKTQSFRTPSGELAPKAIQNLLSNPGIIKAIAKGLKYLGY